MSLLILQPIRFITSCLRAKYFRQCSQVSHNHGKQYIKYQTQFNSHTHSNIQVYPKHSIHTPRIDGLENRQPKIQEEILNCLLGQSHVLTLFPSLLKGRAHKLKLVGLC